MKNIFKHVIHIDMKRLSENVCVKGTQAHDYDTKN
jgi:hypothetical protein